MNLKDKEKLLHLAESTALLAGQHLRSRHEDWLVPNSTSGRDIKLKADQASEALIVENLSASSIPLFCEEAGAVASGAPGACLQGEADLVWIIDPLDGTVNYSQGIPLSCVSIALYEKNEPVLGAVFDFNRGELFSGIVGSGASLNHKPVRVSAVSELSKAVLCTGFPVNMDFSNPVISRFITYVQKFRKVRLLGSAALSLSYVACGRADAYTENRIMFWDVAAGLALVQAAGGIVGMDGFKDLASPVTVRAENGLLKIADI